MARCVVVEFEKKINSGCTMTVDKSCAEEVQAVLMFEVFLGKLKSIRRSDRRESFLIREQNPWVLSPDVKRSLKRLQHECENAGDVETED